MFFLDFKPRCRVDRQAIRDELVWTERQLAEEQKILALRRTKGDSKAAKMEARAVSLCKGTGS
jgi:hypothetical protein